MKKRLSKISLKWKLLLIIVILEFIFFWEKGLFQFLYVPSIAGRDLVGNLSLAYLFDQTFTSGWSNLWMLGFPAFDFYPPLFFLMVNLISKISLGLIGIGLSFRFLTLLCIFLIPLTSYFCFTKLGFGERKSFFVAIFALYYVFISEIYSVVFQALKEGLVLQVFALNLFLIFIPFLWNLRGKKDFILSSILFGAIVLSHPFVSVLTSLAIIYRLILKKENRFKVLLIVLIGLVISTPWLYNLKWIEYTEFYQSGTTNPLNFSIVLFPLILLNLEKNKKKIWLLLLFISCFLVGTLGLPLGTEFLPLQYKRFYHYSIAIGVLISGLGLWKIYEFLNEQKQIKNLTKKSNLYKIILITLLLSPLLVKIGSVQIKPYWKSLYNNTEIYSQIKKLGKGRILTEIDRKNESQVFILQEMIPIKTGKPVLNKLHVDSSLSSPYTLKLQYWISSRPIKNPVCDLCGKNSKFSNKLFKRHLKRFNVKWLVVKTKTSKKKLGNLFNLKKKVGRYWIYETDWKSKYYQSLNYKPILIVSSLEKWKDLNRKIFQNEELSDKIYVWSSNVPTEKNLFSKIYDIRSIEVKKFISELKNKKIELESVESGKIINFTFSENKIHIELEKKHTEKIPILLKFSYYPKWRELNLKHNKAKNYYLASPSLSLIFLENEKTLSYRNFY